MLIQFANIIAGFTVSGSLFKTIPAVGEPLSKASASLLPFKAAIGFVELGLAALNLMYFGGFTTTLFNGSVIQTLVAIALGSLCARENLTKYPQIAQALQQLSPYESYVGVAGILIGLGYFL